MLSDRPECGLVCVPRARQPLGRNGSRPRNGVDLMAKKSKKNSKGKKGKKK